ncbi:MAG: WG repeat-containing protein [Odoribacter splanchnicus]
MGKILYIRLDSSPLPEASDEIIVKDFNLENYFCTLLGKKLLEDAGLAGTMLYPGKLLTDFENFDKEAYKEIIRQWEEVLSALLISQSEKDMDFIFKLPDLYIGWLNTCDISKAFQIKDCYANAVGVTLQRKSLFEIVNGLLKNKLAFFLQRNEGNIDRIVFSIDGINQESYIAILWGSLITHNYELWTLKEFRRYCLFHIKPFQNDYEDARSFSEGLAAVRRNKKWGYINTNGKEVIECEYIMANDFNEGMACVKELNGWGAIDTCGCKKISTIHGECKRFFSEGICAFNTFPKKYGIWRYYNKYGENVDARCMQDAGVFSEGLAIIKECDGYYVLNKDMKPVFYKKTGLSVYDRFRDGLIKYEECLKYGFIDNMGHIVISCIYDELSYFSESLCFVKKDGKWGVIDKKGDIVIPFIFDDFTYYYGFHENLAAVKQNNKWGFVNRIGEIVIPFIYDDYSFGYRFINGFAAVKFNGYWGIIDRKGKNVIPFVYEQLELVFNNLVAVKKGGKWGYINIKGDVVVPFIYDFAKPFCDEMVCVSLNGKFGYINKEWLKDL